jgi:hypothetical protein
MFASEFQEFFDAQTVIAIAERAEAKASRKQLAQEEVSSP